MSRYIDADGIEAAIRKRVYAIEVEDILAEISNTPHIDIVRCGECKYSRKAKSRNSDLNCKWHHRNFKADDFCSYGERSEP